MWRLDPLLLKMGNQTLSEWNQVLHGRKIVLDEMNES